VRILEQAINVQRVLDPDDKDKECDLLLALGDYLIWAGEPQRAFNTELQEAFSLAEAVGDNTRAARACSLAMIGLLLHGGGHPAITPNATQWVERADRYAKPETPARIWVNIGTGEMKASTGFSTRRFDVSNEGCRLLIRNVELARHIDNLEAFCFAIASRLTKASAPQHGEVRLKLAEELVQKLRAGISARVYGIAVVAVIQVILESGQRSRAEEFSNELKEVAERTGQPNLLLESMAIEGVLATLDGRMEDAVTIGRNLLTRGEQLGPAQFAAVLYFWSTYMALLHLGRLDEIPQLLKNDPRLTIPLLWTIVGQDEEEVKVLEQWVVARPGIGSADDETRASDDILLLQAAVRIGHQPAAALLLRRFANSGLCTTGHLFPTCIPRHLGTAAALLGRPEEARKYYDEALKITTEMRFRPELALTRLQLADLLLEHYPDEKADALKHLDFAIKEFREMKMQPSLERALKLRSESPRI
jgi:tetratricopeptide (TPR) repeat protein